MKKLSKLAYLLIALVIMASCEQDSNELENLNKSNEIEALIQEYEFLSDAIEIGIDVQSYIASIEDVELDINESERSVAPPPRPRRNIIYIGECGTRIDVEDGRKSPVYGMQYDIMELMYDVCYESQMPRRPWERPYDAEREFRRGMYFLTMGWAVRGQCSWSEAADIMACVGEFDFDYECDEEPR